MSEVKKGTTLSAEARAKISAANKGRKHAPWSEERRQKIAEANRRRTLSAETRQKIGAAVRAKAAGFSWVRGYKILTGQQDHPLASASGSVPEHRKVLYDKIGPGEHLCHWRCGKTLTWSVDLHADHVDGDKTNNDPDNLVPSCQPCNSSRATAGNPADWSPRVRV